MIREPSWGHDGLVPVIVQDEADGRVLMLAYTDAEALAATLATAQLHFHSRSRNALWRKGATSGNTLRVVDLALDCDGDAILATVRPAGPTCHTGTRSCFDPHDGVDGDAESASGFVAAPADVADAADVADVEPDLPPDQGFAWLETLWSTIDARRRERPQGSYTTQLLDAGVDAVARKVTEEATEVLIAAKDDAIAEGNAQDRSRTSELLAGETADLVYHALVLMAERGLEPRTTLDALRRRHSA